MGLLALGTPLAWDDAKQYANHVREHGITQFLHIWDKLKDRCGDELLWGDEVRLPSSSRPCRGLFADNEKHAPSFPTTRLAALSRFAQQTRMRR